MITKIKWDNHPILGNLKLNFTKSNGEPYNTIILAGENGTGKTAVLETLSAFLSRSTMTPFDYIDYCIADNHYHIYSPNENDKSMGFHIRKNIDDGTEVQIRNNHNNNAKRIETDLADLRHYGFAYSSARSNFKTKPITGSTTEQLDNNKYNVDVQDDFTSIKQLIVDIDTQDNSSWMRIAKKSENISYEEFKQTSKMYRFEKAFNNFFEKLKFKEVDNISSNREAKIIFEKNGKVIPIDNLSTGEKQIVFRGTQLLRNANTLNGGIILIDEPELSMHPQWQEKILDYYRGLFCQNNAQTVQMIFATHSQYVLKSALNDRNNVQIITLSENNGCIKENIINAPTTLPVITAAETNYLAFNIYSVDYHIELYGYLQAKINKTKIKECDDYILSQPEFNRSLHSKISSFKNTQYKTLCTYIRNAINHPDSGNSYTPEELKRSIELLIKLCQ